LIRLAAQCEATGQRAGEAEWEGLTRDRQNALFSGSYQDGGALSRRRFADPNCKLCNVDPQHYLADVNHDGKKGLAAANDVLAKTHNAFATTHR
jgi:hypothetical protein